MFAILIKYRYVQFTDVFVDNLIKHSLKPKTFRFISFRLTKFFSLKNRATQSLNPMSIIDFRIGRADILLKRLEDRSSSTDPRGNDRPVHLKHGCQKFIIIGVQQFLLGSRSSSSPFPARNLSPPPPPPPPSTGSRCIHTKYCQSNLIRRPEIRTRIPRVSTRIEFCVFFPSIITLSLYPSQTLPPTSSRETLTCSHSPGGGEERATAVRIIHVSRTTEHNDVSRPRGSL